MGEDLQLKAYSALATEIGQKAVTIATLQAQLDISNNYIRKLEADNEQLQEQTRLLSEVKDSLQKQLDELKVEGVEQ
nr:MAG TPA: Myc proto-oncogene protein, Protein max/Max, APOPTOSIS.35A [Caudoviricetes sp.]DAR68770.1 MAG TPA: Myc proto-oncogene protein, Protein max/Max, APOPTOSIS.35A [Caudoviricetes sp.]